MYTFSTPSSYKCMQLQLSKELKKRNTARKTQFSGET